jgi:hypothetical protein
VQPNCSFEQRARGAVEAGILRAGNVRADRALICWRAAALLGR